MSEWITDRPPTEDDEGTYGYLWVTTENGVALLQSWAHAGDQPWMPITPPEPYVKPKRWKVAYDRWHKCWTVFDMRHITHLTQLFKDTDAHREAAERIAAIYEEVMP